MTYPFDVQRFAVLLAGLLLEYSAGSVTTLAIHGLGLAGDPYMR
jgi:biotin transporter BioY